MEAAGTSVRREVCPHDGWRAVVRIGRRAQKVHLPNRDSTPRNDVAEHVANAGLSIAVQGVNEEAQVRPPRASRTDDPHVGLEELRGEARKPTLLGFCEDVRGLACP